MEPRSIFITGASSGFGLGATTELARRGHHVFATMRGTLGKNREQAEALRAAAQEHDWRVDVLELDVTDDASVDGAVESALDAAGHIDVLINNAGVGTFGIQEAYPVEQVQRIFDVNVFGVLRMNRAILPSMRARGRGHVIYVSSGLGRFLFPFVGPYAASKFALEALAETGHYELRYEGIDTTIIQPGAFGTDFGGKMVGPDDAGTVDSYDEAKDRFAAMGALFAERGAVGEFGDPQLVIDALVEAAESDEGNRPLRVPLLADAAASINEACAEAQRGVLEWMQV